MKNNKGNIFILLEIDNIYDFNRVFYHPGGIYVQKDFDRKKKQFEEKHEKVTAAFNILKKLNMLNLMLKHNPQKIFFLEIMGKII